MGALCHLLWVCTGISNPQNHDLGSLKVMGRRHCPVRHKLFQSSLSEDLCLSAGLAFLPASVSYLIGTSLFGVLANKMGQYVAWGSGRSQMGESSEVLPAAGMMGDSLRLKI